jgi:hypothetical protein
MSASCVLGNKEHAVTTSVERAHQEQQKSVTAEGICVDDQRTSKHNMSKNVRKKLNIMADCLTVNMSHFGNKNVSPRSMTCVYNCIVSIRDDLLELLDRKSSSAYEDLRQVYRELKHVIIEQSRNENYSATEALHDIGGILDEALPLVEK